MPDRTAPPVVSVPVDVVDPGPVAPGRGTGVGGRRTGRFSLLRVLVVVIVVAAVATGWLLTRPTGPAYRTATVAPGTAVATLSAVGTITPVEQADLTFAVAGTVGTVDVTVGQHVIAGQVVASLDPTSLQSAVVAAEAELASAQATLATDETTQAGGTATTTSTTSSNSASGSGSGSGSGGGGTTNSSASAGGTAAGTNPAVTKLQAALVADQHQEDAAAAAAGSALQTATTVCTAGSTPGVVGGQTPASPGPPPGGPGGGGQPTCTQALAAASTAHQALVTAIDKVTKDEAALAAALGLSGSGGSAGSGGGGPGGAGTGSPGSGDTPTPTSTTHPTTTSTTAPGGSSTGSTSAATTRSSSSASPSTTGSSSTTGSRTRTVTPELIALDQANVDVVQAALTNAQRAASQSSLVSTLAGTIGSVALVQGQTVGAGSPSSAPQVVVVGSGSDYQVTTTVPVTKIQQVALGQQALVTPDSSSTVLTGTVSGIGVLGTSTTTSTTYPVTIAFQSPDLGPFSGSESSVQIVTSQASDVTTVPSSAVRTVGSNHLVTLVQGGTATSVRVTLGTVGAIRTQILSGVHVGESVSLATVSYTHLTLPTNREV